jgi:acetoin:2,6-dichlorophenolindophenol oxidoreductase subunit beta
MTQTTTVPDVQFNYRTVIARAIADEMDADPRVVLLGEDVAAAGGAFKTTAGLYEKFGPRVRDTPIAEQAIVGMAVGAAVMGLRPIAEIMFADFAGVCFDQIVNSLAKYRYTTGGQVSAPVTIRMANGAGAGFGPQHSQPAENWFLNVPGIKLVAPGTVEDLYGLLRSAIQDDDPVIVFEHKNLFSVKGRISSDAELAPHVPIGVAEVVREGTDVTLVALQQMRHRAVEAAEQLERDGISVAVIDPRTITPFDLNTVLASLRTTSRVVIVQEGSAPGSWGASLLSTLACEHFELFDAPPHLVCSDHVPVPYGAQMEAAWLPDRDRITAAVRSVMTY